MPCSLVYRGAGGQGVLIVSFSERVLYISYSMYNSNLLVLISSLFQHKLTKLLFYNTKDIYMFSEAFTTARSLDLHELTSLTYIQCERT